MNDSTSYMTSSDLDVDFYESEPKQTISFLFCKINFIVSEKIESIIGTLYSLKSSDKKNIVIKMKVKTIDALNLSVAWEDSEVNSVSFNLDSIFIDAKEKFSLKEVKMYNHDPEKSLCFLRLKLTDITRE